MPLRSSGGASFETVLRLSPSWVSVFVSEYVVSVMAIEATNW